MSFSKLGKPIDFVADEGDFGVIRKNKLAGIQSSLL